MQSVNVFSTPICVDAISSERWSSSTQGYCMCLTRSHCQLFGHWLTTKGDWLSIRDYELLQGIPPGLIDYEGAVKPRSYAAMLGNAMSMNVLMALVPCVLHAAGLIDEAALAVFRAQTALYLEHLGL